jgi:hypothetical protein
MTFVRAFPFMARHHRRLSSSSNWTKNTASNTRSMRDFLFELKEETL